MAATSVPQLIAYAETTGYAGYRGLTTAGPPLAVWGLTTGHPFMNAGVTSITALMTKSDLDGDNFVQQYGEQAYVDLVAAYSLSIGIASAVLGVVGFGKLAQSVPTPVRSGFKWGCVCSTVTWSCLGVLAVVSQCSLFALCYFFGLVDWCLGGGTTEWPLFQGELGTQATGSRVRAFTDLYCSLQGSISWLE